MKNIIRLVNEELWLMRSGDFPLPVRMFLNTARVLVLTFRRFWQNECFLKASALTYYTLFSIVPVLALIFGISQGYGCSEILERKLTLFLEKYPGLAEKIISAINRTLQNTKGGAIAGIGILLLLWSAIKLMSHMERSLNAIWGITKGRSFCRKLTDYLAILVICPFLIIAGSSFLIVARVHLHGLFQTFGGTGVSELIQRNSSFFLPVISALIVFTFIYYVIPNTKVQVLPALISGLTASVIYMMLLNFYVTAQSTIVAYNAIYGSFAALPLFLIWLNLSWVLLLGGAQLTFAIQHVQEYEMLPMDCILSQNNRYIYSMEILRKLTHHFESAQGPLTDEELSVQLRIPVRTIRMLLRDLVRCGVLTEVNTEQDGCHAYQQAQPTEKLTPVLLIRALNNLDGLPFRDGEEKELERQLKQIMEEAAQSQKNQLTYHPRIG